MKITILLLVCILFAFNSKAQDGFTQADRENMLRLQIEMKENFKNIDLRIEMLNKETAEIKRELVEIKRDNENSKNTIFTAILTVFGLLFTAYIALFGFIYWDRKTAIKAVEIEQQNLRMEVSTFKEKLSVYEKIFKEVSAGKMLTPELLHQYGL